MGEDLFLVDDLQEKGGLVEMEKEQIPTTIICRQANVDTTSFVKNNLLYHPPIMDSPRSLTCPIDVLPADMVCHIFSFIEHGGTNWKNVLFTCKKWLYLGKRVFGKLETTTHPSHLPEDSEVLSLLLLLSQLHGKNK